MNSNPVTTVVVPIHGAGGYSADQIIQDGRAIRLSDLMEMVEDAIEQYGDDAQVVTYDGSNLYGAKYGFISTFDGIYEEEEEE